MEYDAKAGCLTGSARCEGWAGSGCGSSYVVTTWVEAVDLLHAEGEVEDDDLSDEGERAKADNAAADAGRD